MSYIHHAVGYMKEKSVFISPEVISIKRNQQKLNILHYTARNVGDKAKVLNTMKAEVAWRLIRRCMATIEQTYSMISLNTASN